MPYRLLQGGRRRRRWRLRTALLVLLLATAGGLYAAIPTAEPPRRPAPQAEAPPAPLLDSGTAPLAGGGTAPSPLAVRLEDPRDSVRIRFKRPPRSALLFDLNTGRVLWRRDPTRVLPIASLTKMMTALVVVERVKPGSKVRVTKEALRYRGSGVGPAAAREVDRRQHDAPRAAAAIRQRHGDRARTARRGRQRAALRALHEREGRGDGPAVHALCLLEWDRRPRQPLVRRGSRGDRPRRAAPAAAGADRAPALGGAAVPDQGRAAVALQQQPARAPGLSRDHGCQDRLHRGRGALPGGHARAAAAIRLGVVLLDSPDPAKQARQLLDRGFKAV